MKLVRREVEVNIKEERGNVGWGLGSGRKALKTRRNR